MAFRTFLNSLGSNAPQVETVLDNPAVRPGGTLAATATARGGGVDVRIERLALELVVRVEESEGDSESAWNNPGVLAYASAGPFDLPAGATIESRLDIPVHWETPLTHALGHHLKGARAAVRTILGIDNAVDKGDFDEIAVHALPAQDALFQAHLDTGFRFIEAEVKEHWRDRGKNQTQPFCQELEFSFPPDYNRPPADQLETVFMARSDSLDLILGQSGPHEFRYADLDPDAWTRWFDQHCRSEFQMSAQ